VLHELFGLWSDLIFELSADCTINLIWQLSVIANTITDAVCLSRCYLL
jgi:hypothetical protein